MRVLKIHLTIKALLLCAIGIVFLCLAFLGGYEIGKRKGEENFLLYWGVRSALHAVETESVRLDFLLRGDLEKDTQMSSMFLTGAIMSVETYFDHSALKPDEAKEFCEKNLPRLQKLTQRHDAKSVLLFSDHVERLAQRCRDKQ